MEKRITVKPVELRLDDAGNYTGSVSVASPDALVVIEELALISDDTLSAYAIVTEDVDE